LFKKVRVDLATEDVDADDGVQPEKRVESKAQVKKGNAHYLDCFVKEPPLL
jgi:hypothetical protein